MATKKKSKISGTKKRPVNRPKKAGARVKTAAGKTSKPFQSMTFINEKLSLLENQALKAYECVQAIRKRSTPDWKEWIDKLSPQDWSALADAQRERISLEVKHLSDEILSKINKADILCGKDNILEGAKSSLEDIVNKINTTNLVDKAIDTAIHTKDGLLAFLNIPTHEEMTQLQRKLKRLEQRMHQMSDRPE